MVFFEQKVVKTVNSEAICHLSRNGRILIKWATIDLC